MCKIRKKFTIEKVNPAKKLIFLAGLTLVELVIVIVIVGIIAGFVIPGYLGVRQRAEGRGASALLRLVQTAEKVRHLESSLYIACTGYAACNTALDLDLPDDDGWVYAVVCAGGDCSTATDFTATAVNDDGTCTYSITKDTAMTSSAGCIYEL